MSRYLTRLLWTLILVFPTGTLVYPAIATTLNGYSGYSQECYYCRKPIDGELHEVRQVVSQEYLGECCHRCSSHYQCNSRSLSQVGQALPDDLLCRRAGIAGRAGAEHIQTRNDVIRPSQLDGLQSLDRHMMIRSRPAKPARPASR